MHLFIKLLENSLRELYDNHETYHEGDSGLDLFIPEGINIKANSVSNVIDLGIACAAYMDENCEKPTSYYLYPRSSMGSKTPLRLSNSVGIIDSGYRGNIKIIVDNISDEDYFIPQGTRLVQLCDPSLNCSKFDMVSSLSRTVRGTSGLGSTGGS